MGAVAGTSSRCAIDASPDADGLRPHRASYRGRHGGRGKGRFLVLGSASIDLLRQASESLAGRIRYLELGPLDADEVGRKRLDALWLRGGFPESLLAAALARALAVDAKTIASLIATAPGGTEAHFFRTAAGAGRSTCC